MKKLCLTLLCFFLLCGVGFATDSIVLGVGTASGETEFSKLDSDLSSLIVLKHDLSGTGFNFGYQKIRENGLLLGIGYQNFAVSGGKSAVVTLFRTTSTVELKTEQFRFSGFYGEIGYNFETTENLFFQPSVRLGIGNNYEASYSFSSDNPRLRDINPSASGSGGTFGFVFPLVYQVDNLKFGGQIVLPGMSFNGIANDYELTTEISTAYQFVVGYNFSP